jgi:chitodextrinase
MKLISAYRIALASTALTLLPTFAAAAECHAPWQADQAYSTASVVSQKGNDYRAKWWTKGENPSLNYGSTKVWEQLAACQNSNTTPAPTARPTPSSTPYLSPSPSPKPSNTPLITPTPTATPITTPTVTASPAPSTAPVNSACLQEWVALNSYTAGETVTRNGVNYQARWWTQNNDPATSSSETQAWKNLGACVTATPTPPTFDYSQINAKPTQYTSMRNVLHNLQAWEGQHVAVLSRRADASPLVMRAMVKTFDDAYRYYRNTTGHTPGNYFTYNGKLSIADVDDTCGFACGFLNVTGIEIQRDGSDILYNGVEKNNQYDHVVFYELGRNFWGFGPKLEFKEPDNSDAIVTGFAVFMRFQSMEAVGIEPAPFGSVPFKEFKTQVQGLVDLYLADPTLNWENTLKISRAPNNILNLGGTDLFASFLYRLKRDYGGEAFISRLWHEVAKRPAATSTQGAVDNFFLATCAAANKNLSTLFINTWRWPISAEAQSLARTYP